jgi:hypothetical protein
VQRSDQQGCCVESYCAHSSRSFPIFRFLPFSSSRFLQFVSPLFLTSPSLCLFYTFPSYTILFIYGFDLTFFDTSVSHGLLPSLLSLFRFLLMLLELLNFKCLFVSSFDSCLLGSINLLLLSVLLFFIRYLSSPSPLCRA